MTVTTSKNQTLGGDLSIKLNLGNKTSGSSGSKTKSGDKSGESGSGETGGVSFIPQPYSFNTFCNIEEDSDCYQGEKSNCWRQYLN